MSSANSRTARNFTKVVAVLLLSSVTASAWELDFSRRQTEFNRVSNQDRLPASVHESEPVGLLERVFDPTEPTQDVVIMNTEKGFVPESVYFRKGGSYRIHVVNVNPKQKNASVIFDAFSEHHSTFFGQVKTFTVTPKADGVFSYQCPETAMQGKVVVMSPERKPASK